MDVHRLYFFSVLLQLELRPVEGRHGEFGQQQGDGERDGRRRVAHPQGDSGIERKSDVSNRK